MATRLNQGHRATLKELAKRVVDVPAEAKAEEAAYQRAAPLVRALVEAEFPPAEMAILQKHECARRDRCINVRLDISIGGDHQFRFRNVDTNAEDYDESDSDQHPLVPSRNSCRNRWYIANARTSKAVLEWVRAEDARRKALNEKRAKYETFISNATTYEQVLEIWPEAIQVADSITRNLPVAINEEVLAEIKADSARRMKRAA